MVNPRESVDIAPETNEPAGDVFEKVESPLTILTTKAVLWRVVYGLIKDDKPVPSSTGETAKLAGICQH